MKAKTLRLVFEKSVFPIMMMIFMGKPAMVMMGKPKKTDTTFLTNQFVCNVKIHIQDLVRCVGEGVSPLHKNFYARQYESFIYWQNWYEISIRSYCLVASSTPSRVWRGLELEAAPSRSSPGVRIRIILTQDCENHLPSKFAQFLLRHNNKARGLSICLLFVLILKGGYCNFFILPRWT